jgi:hypothetical protein
MKVVSTLAVVLSLQAALISQHLEPTQAWSQFQTGQGSEWTAEWNPATGTPKAVYGPGLKLGQAVKSVAAARTQSTNLLNQFAALLGRGSSSFVETIGIKANQTYIFVYDQSYRNLPVISGRADVRIHEVGTVAMFGSSSVHIPNGFDIKPGITALEAQAIAHQHVLGSQQAGERAALPQLVVWADTTSKLRTTATLAFEVQIDQRPAQLAVGKTYIDAKTGAILEFKNEVYDCFSCGTKHVSSAKGSRHAKRMNKALTKIPAVKAPAVRKSMVALTGKVMGWTNLGILPTATLTNTPLANIQVTSSAGSAYTDINGNFSIPYTGNSPVTVNATLAGRHSQRVRVSTGTQLSASASVTPGTAATLQFGNANMGELSRSQTTTYWHVDDANVWLRSLLPGATGPMNTISNVNPRVNINSNCNAYYTSNTINFYTSGGGCNMTAYQTVVVHEWGHGLDAVFGGISQTDGLSEGWGDLLGLYRSGQPELGAGFRTGTTNGIRSGNNSNTYPAGGGVHQQGTTWMGWAWDLRKNLIVTHGSTNGPAIAERIVVASIAADATNQPDAVREVFILDDDDGNLNNGTPNYLDLEKASLKRNLPYPKRTNPNAGSYSLYGAGCAGSGKRPANCLNVNDTGSRQNYGTRASLTYAIRATAPGNLQVTGFEIETSGNQTVTTRIYSDNNGQPGTVLGSSTMVVGGSTGWYATNFATPVNIASGQDFYIAFVNNAATISASIRSGVNTPYFRNDGAGGSWNGPLGGFPWAYRVQCTGGPGAVPSFTNSGVPELNTSFSLSLRDANPNASGFLVIGASDSSWGGTSLPMDLTPLGASGCKLLASLDILVGVTVNSSGALTQNFAVPDNNALVGFEFYNQYAIADAANTFGVVMSNGGRGKIGKQ